MRDISQEFGELKGRVEGWIESDRKQHETLFNHISHIMTDLNAVKIDVSEVKANVTLLKDSILKVLQQNVWSKFWDFAKTPRGNLTISLFIIILSAFYLGVDRIVEILTLVMKGNK